MSLKDVFNYFYEILNTGIISISNDNYDNHYNNNNNSG